MSKEVRMTKSERVDPSSFGLRHSLDIRHSSLELFNSDVFVPGFAGAAAVDLQSDDAGLLDRRVGLGVVHGLLAVDPELNMPPLAANAILVPIVELEHFGQLIGLGLGGCLAAA